MDRFVAALLAMTRGMTASNTSVIPGRAKREPGISQDDIEIPGLRLRRIPE
jgi:hypothetical protein